MKRNLTVFLSGTFSDLVEEREAVLDAVRKLQLQHDSMEFFGARPGVPIETCLAEVRQSDILVVIVGHRYGSLVRSVGISFSEAEYEEGFRLGKPCLVYMLDENVPVLPKNIERDPDKLRLLERWKDLLRERHTIATYANTHDLAVRVAADLGRTIQALGESEQSRLVEGLASSDIEELVNECKELGLSRELLLSTIRRAFRAAANADTDREPQIFLSYSHADGQIVREVADRLRASGVGVWFDEVGVRTGDSLIQTIEHALDSSDFVAFFISSKALGSPWPQKELNMAMSRLVSGQGQAILLPILLDDVEIPSLLRNVTYIDLRDRDADRAARQLAETIRRRWTKDRVGQPGALSSRGGRIRAFVNVRVTNAESVERLEHNIKGMPEVVEVTRTFGSIDVVVVLAAEDFPSITRIVAAISGISGVMTTSTLIGTL